MRRTRRAPTARPSRPGRACFYAAVLGTLSNGSNAVPPPDYMARPPDGNSPATPNPCRVRLGGSTNGHGPRILERGTYTNGAGVPATRARGGPPQRTARPSPRWRPRASRTPGTRRTSPRCPPTGRATSVGREPPGAMRPAGAWSAGTYFSGVAATSGNRLCRWPSFNYVSDPGAPASNPIAANRSPGFWGVIRGPGDVTDLGDAFSVRCRVTQNCGTTHEPARTATTGYWYVIKMPASGATTTTIRLFDAAYNDSINASSGAGPAADQGGTFTQRQRVHHHLPAVQAEQPARLHRSHGRRLVPDPVRAGPDQLRHDLDRPVHDHAEQRRDLPPERDVHRVRRQLRRRQRLRPGGGRRPATRSAPSNRPSTPTPTWPCGPRRTAPATPASTWPRSARSTPARRWWSQLFDAGDFTGAATRAAADAQDRNCADAQLDLGVLVGLLLHLLAGPEHPVRQRTSTSRTTTSPADHPARRTPRLPNCEITTQSGPANATRRFNDTWLTIKVDVPDGLHLHARRRTRSWSPDSCWWGVRYDYANGAGETTTWRARVEGNPVHLTQ